MDDYPYILWAKLANYKTITKKVSARGLASLPLGASTLQSSIINRINTNHKLIQKPGCCVFDYMAYETFQVFTNWVFCKKKKISWGLQFRNLKDVRS